MATTLCLDFGNTRYKAAIFDGDVLAHTVVLKNDITEQVADLLNNYQPAHAILSSVVQHDLQIETLLQQKTDFHRLSHLSNLPFTIPVSKPQTVGTDRLAIAAAAVHLHPHTNTLAIALGTCITYNFINQQHQLIGGSISPGVGMRFKALQQFTAALPLVESNWNVPLIGYDTVTNIQSGVVLGTAKEIDGIIESYENKFGNFNALLTGGDIPMLAPHLKREIFADPELIFNGLYAISKLNYVTNQS